jgi:hypothetical protein
MPTQDVFELAQEVRARLERGDLALAGPVDLGPDGTWTDAERAARIVLADVAHGAQRERARGDSDAAYWRILVDQLRVLLQAGRRRRRRAEQRSEAAAGEE